MCESVGVPWHSDRGLERQPEVLDVGVHCYTGQSTVPGASKESVSIVHLLLGALGLQSCTAMPDFTCVLGIETQVFVYV